MFRPQLVGAALSWGPVFFLTSWANAQDAEFLSRERLKPITAPSIEIEGTLDLRTGRFQRTRQASFGLGGQQSVYDNTCASPFYLGLEPAGPSGTGSACAETLGDYGAIPATTFPGDATCTPGCADSYDITSFEIAWCQLAAPPSGSQILLHFWSAPLTEVCAGGPLPLGPGCTNGNPVPGVPPALSATLTGLPRCNAIGTLACYVLNVTLATPGFTIAGSTSFAPANITGDKFAWAFTMPTSTGSDGPVLSGDLTPFSSPCAPCAGTLWEVGGQSTISGTGAGQSSSVFFEDYGGTSTPAGGSCFLFGGAVPVGTHLELFANKPCDSSPSFLVFCDGGDNSLGTCPCDPGLADTGCNIPLPAMEGGGLSGGVRLRPLTQQTSPLNRATLQSTGFPATTTPAGVVFRNTGVDPLAPVVFGDGLRCVDASASPGTLVRIGAAAASGGTMLNELGHSAMAGTGTFFYQLWFRSTPVSYCDPSAAFNLSNGTTLDW